MKIIIVKINIKKNNFINENKTQSQSTKKILEYNSTINNNNDINENEKSYSSIENTNNNISDKSIKSISLIKNEAEIENDIYKKNKNIITPQLGSKIKNINNNIFTQNTPDKYDIDEREKYIIDNMPLMINLKIDNDFNNPNENKNKDIGINNNEKIKNEFSKLNDKKINKELNKEKIYRNELTFLDDNVNTIKSNKSNITFSEKNKNKKKNKNKIDFPIDLNCIINLSFSEIKSKIKSYFKKNGYFYNEKDNIIKIRKGNTNIEMQIYKFNEDKNLFYLKIKLKSNEMKKDKEKIAKLLTILNHSKFR